MPNIGATNVTYTIGERKKIGRKYFVFAQVSFGNAVLTYPSGGIPLTTAKFEVTDLDSVEIIESNGKALKYEWDRSANTIRIFNPTTETSGGNQAGTEYVASTTAPATTVLQVEAWGE